MIDFEEAKVLVFAFINDTFRLVGEPLVIIERETIEKEYGWIFFYNTKSFVEQGDVSNALAGNSPLVCEKRDASIHFLGSTALPTETLIKAYEESRDKQS